MVYFLGEILGERFNQTTDVACEGGVNLLIILPLVEYLEQGLELPALALLADVQEVVHEGLVPGAESFAGHEGVLEAPLVVGLQHVRLLGDQVEHLLNFFLASNAGFRVSVGLFLRGFTS